MQRFVHGNSLDLNTNTKRPFLAGHRGDAGNYPENTIISFDSALRHGADFIELDIQQTKDGSLVVIHDHTVDRTTNGKGKVGEMSFEEIRLLDAGSWFDSRFKGETIPAFTEVLERYRGKIGFLIELKKPSLYRGIEAKVAETLKDFGLDSPGMHPVIIQSFDRNSLVKMKRLLPGVPRGLLVRHRPYGVFNWELRRITAFADFFNPKRTMLKSSLVRKAHQHGLKMIVWTAANKSEAEQLRATGVDGIVVHSFSKR
ncbi:glycerophosphodiester phosphodiesterase [Bacillus massilinigeriensis]|uniref:glycerophosphodiester phosphodiesterase n=1 Tax=Bacillus mediterraneensis TaxID=1805474 RepID=UPI0008F96D5E|nr:glycerophosphodiester phosphodiesterase family protein [Bacillus mediterraneensis]